MTAALFYTVSMIVGLLCLAICVGRYLRDLEHRQNREMVRQLCEDRRYIGEPERTVVIYRATVTCMYCGSTGDGGRCASCGAPR